MQLDPADESNKNDLKAIDNVITQERVVIRHLEKNDYETALTYVDQVLNSCPGSERHTLQKIEYQVRTANLTDANTFSQQAASMTCFR